ncbi:MAG: hypothetical protein ACLPN5_11220 [Roseiarcus sp.]
MAQVVIVLVALIIAVVAYLALWPVPIAPRVWRPGRDAGFTGPFALNDLLAKLERIELGGGAGPEHIAFGPDGKLYTALKSGDILRMNPDGGARERVVNTGGRVLGFAFDAAGRLIAADSMRGLLAVEHDAGVSVLADLQDPTGAYPETTAAAEFGDRRYIMSLTATWIGWMRRPR